MSCSDDIADDTLEQVENISNYEFKGEVVLTRTQTNALVKNGVNPVGAETLEKTSFKLFGERHEGVNVNDIFISNENLDEMTQNNRLFASTNRVDLPNVGKRILRVGGITNGVDQLSTPLVIALITATAKYNALNMNKLAMVYVPITEAQANAGQDAFGPIDIVAFVDSGNNFVGNADGRATFPNAGNPGPFFGLSTNTANFSLKNNTILIMHELGHTIGMAHADFLTRGSCGNTAPLDPELGDLAGVANVTEVCNIAGTDDSGNFGGSIMRACGFFGFPTADFTAEDVDAFTKLYSQIEIPCEGEEIDEGEFCIELPTSLINQIIASGGEAWLNNLIAAGIICPI